MQHISHTPQPIHRRRAVIIVNAIKQVYYGFKHTLLSKLLHNRVINLLASTLVYPNKLSLQIGLFLDLSARITLFSSLLFLCCRISIC